MTQCDHTIGIVYDAQYTDIFKESNFNESPYYTENDLIRFKYCPDCGEKLIEVIE